MVARLPVEYSESRAIGRRRVASIVVDEAVTTGRGFFAPTRAAASHDWLSNMGGSIGMGMPVATGAAVACPDRKVVCLEGDGSGMCT